MQFATAYRDDQLDGGAPPIVELAIVQMTSFCNIDCSYCYLGGRSLKNRLEPATISQIVGRLFEYGHLASPFHWQWHAGEPLTVGVSHFDACQSAVESAFAEHKWPLYTSLQTNGTLIDRRWAEFFAARRIRPGISIDGPQDIHDAKRRDRAGRGTHKATLAGLQHLMAAGVDLRVLCVVGPNSLRRGEEIVAFFGELGIQSLAFNFEETEGENRVDSYAKLGDTELRSLMADFVRDVVATREKLYPLMRIREFHSLQTQLLEGQTLCRTLNEPYYCLTFSTAGDVTTFAPELAGERRSDGSSLWYGNVKEMSLMSILRGVLDSADYKEIRQGVDLCRNSCEYFSFCGGGSPSNKLFENGSFASSETRYCRIRYKFFTDAALDYILSPREATCS